MNMHLKAKKLLKRVSMDSNGFTDDVGEVPKLLSVDDNNGDCSATLIDSTTDQLQHQSFEESDFPLLTSPHDVSHQIQMDVENNGEINGVGENLETNVTQTSSREDVINISSESDYIVTSENPEATATSTATATATTDSTSQARKKFKYRHTPDQVEELETAFEECNHPSETERLNLSRRLNMNPLQVKFWFQNRRTQMKTQSNRHVNCSLKQENDRLREMNRTMRLAIMNATCTHCRGHGHIVNGQISLEEHNHTTEETPLDEEMDTLFALFNGSHGQSITPAAGSNHSHNSTLNTSVSSNHCAAGGGSDVAGGSTSASASSLPTNTGGARCQPVIVPGIDRISKFWELAISAFEEFLALAMTDEPLWLRNSGSGCLALNQEEYKTKFFRPIGLKPDWLVSEASKDSGMINRNSLHLVQTLMDSARWVEMFPWIIGRTTTKEIVCGGSEGTLSGALHLMDAEFLFLSPLVPIRQVKFLRYSQLIHKSVWVVVDVSVEEEDGSSPSCRRLPSGCLIQELSNGYSKVTWIEHAEMNGRFIHPSYKPLFNAGLAFGAQRWLAALQRQCESLTDNIYLRFPYTLLPLHLDGKKSMLNLAKRMTASFCNGVCASSDKWDMINTGNPNVEIRILAKRNVNVPGEPKGTILNATTCVYIPIPPRHLFELLEDLRLRPLWDILCDKEPLQEITHIDKSLNQSNSISLIRVNQVDPRHKTMMIFQEKSIDTSGALIVHAPVGLSEMQDVMAGADSSNMSVLPSGFAILPEAIPPSMAVNYSDSIEPWWMTEGGSLLTVTFQILMSSLPLANITEDSIYTINHLVLSTVRNIRNLIVHRNN